MSQYVLWIDNKSISVERSFIPILLAQGKITGQTKCSSDGETWISVDELLKPKPEGHTAKGKGKNSEWDIGTSLPKLSPVFIACLVVLGFVALCLLKVSVSSNSRIYASDSGPSNGAVFNPGVSLYDRNTGARIGKVIAVGDTHLLIEGENGLTVRMSRGGAAFRYEVRH